MPYGIIKVDQVTFTNAGVDQTISVSGIVASISGNITATGTISGNVIRGGTTVSGATVTGTAGQFGTITGNTAGFTTVTGTTVTGTTATFTSGVFTNISGGTHTITSGVFASGTAANPSITFQGDVNTGIYSPGADQVAISTNGSGRLFVDSSGRVGIGISSPQVLVHGTTSVSSSTEYAGVGFFENSLNNVDTSPTTAFPVLKLTRAGKSGVSYRSSASFGIARYENPGTQARTRLDIALGHGDVPQPDTTVMSLLSSGAVGIGTTAPIAKLDIYKGAGGSYADALILSNDAAFGANQGIAWGSSANISGRIRGLDDGAYGTHLIFESRAGSGPSTTTTERARIDSSGRLLVGTSTARGVGTSYSFPIQNENTTAAGITFVTNTNDAESSYLVLGKSRGTSVGSNTIVQANDVIGRIAFAGADGTDLETRAATIEAQVDGTPGANDMPGRLVFSTTADGASSPTQRLGIYSNGAIELTNGGLYLAASAIISGAGTNAVRYSTATGRITYDSSSRLIKNDIVDCPYGIEAVMQLQPRKYFRTDDQCTEIGFIADEVSAVMPEFVPFGPKSVITQDDEDTEQIPLGVNYDKLTAVLTKALQEAIAKIETLEQRLADAGIA